MTAGTLLASGILAWGSAAGFIAIATLTLRGNEGGGARLAFAVFWLFSGAIALAQGARSLAAAAGLDSFALVRALDQTATPAYCFAAAGLLYYVVYLLTGRAGLAVPIGVYYLAMIPLLRFQVEAARPVSYAVHDWQVNLVYEGSLQTPAYMVALGLTAGPVIAAVVLYSVVVMSASKDSARYRTGCVSLGLVLWLLTEVATWATGLSSTPYGEFARRGMGLVIAAVVIAGYIPPAAARRRWGAVAIGE